MPAHEEELAYFHKTSAKVYENKGTLPFSCTTIGKNYCHDQNKG